MAVESVSPSVDQGESTGIPLAWVSGGAPSPQWDPRDGIVLEAVKTFALALALVLLALAVVDPWLLRPALAANATAGAVTISLGMLRSVTLFLSLAASAIYAWLAWRPPAAAWANTLAFGLGMLCLARAVCWLLASPTVFRVEQLAMVFVAMGCVFLSMRPLAAYLSLASLVWFSVAWWSNPDEPWFMCGLVLVTALAVSMIVCHVRGRSFAKLLDAERQGDRLRGDVSVRVQLGETASRISDRFLRSDADDIGQVINEALREIGEVLRMDHVFLCRFNQDRLTISTTHEWSAPRAEAPGTAAGGLHQNRIWFNEKVLSRHATVVSDSSNLPSESQDGRGVFTRLGARSFASIPLSTKQNLPWGYLGVAHFASPIDWSANEVQFLRAVGENLLLTLERHEAEAAVRRSEARFRQLFEANLFPVYFANVFGTITDGNDAFFDLTGHERADLPMRWDDLIPEECRARYDASIARLVARGVDPAKEIEVRHLSGERIPILLGQALLLRERGDFIALAIDLREQRDAERKIQEMHGELHRAARLGMMGEMAAGLAHEIHQPLAAISNFANGARRRLARGRLKEEDLAEVLHVIGELCDQAGSVAGNIRTFVRGRFPARSAVSVNEMIERSLEISKFEIRRCEVGVKLDLHEDLPPAWTNGTELTQILVNLILNAAHAMEDQASARQLTLRTRLGEPGRVQILVHDTGPGIADDVQSRLFDQFFTTKEQGLGMGLPLSRSIAQTYGGDLRLLDTSAEGTAFAVELPIATAANAVV